MDNFYMQKNMFNKRIILACVFINLWGIVNALLLVIQLPHKGIILKNIAYNTNSIIYFSCAPTIRLFYSLGLIDGLEMLKWKVVFIIVQSFIYCLFLIFILIVKYFISKICN